MGKNWFVILSELNSKDTYKIAVVMGSDSDLKTLKPTVDILREFGIKTEVSILSAHRTPIEMMEYAKNAESENISNNCRCGGCCSSSRNAGIHNLHSCNWNTSRE